MTEHKKIKKNELLEFGLFFSIWFVPYRNLSSLSFRCKKLSAKANLLGQWDNLCDYEVHKVGSVR